MTDTRHLPPSRAENWDWQLHAACRNLDDTVFFHPEHERGGPRRRREDAAKAVCARCPVRTECLRHALRVGESYGVWGGLGETERHALLAHAPQH